MDEVQVTDVRRKHGRVVRFRVWVSGKRPVESDPEPDAVDDDPAKWVPSATAAETAARYEKPCATGGLPAAFSVAAPSRQQRLSAIELSNNAH